MPFDYYTGNCHTDHCFMSPMWPCMIYRQLLPKLNINWVSAFKIFYDCCMISRKQYMMFVWLLETIKTIKDLVW